MREVSQRIREEARSLLKDKRVDLVIGFERGTLPLRSTPVFIRDEAEVERLVWNSFCENNLAKYLTKVKKGKIAFVAKGCDARSLAALIVERQIERENLTIIGVPCQRMVDRRKIEKKTADLGEILEAYEEGKEIVVRGEGFERNFRREDFLYPSCETCLHRNPPIFDTLIREEVEEEGEKYAEALSFEGKSTEERWARFVEETYKCIRCYACREACPMCYCVECFVDSSFPKWIGKGLEPSDVQVWHLVRAYHQTGRCVGCGACERACPMEINLLYLMQKINRDVEELFGFETGISLEQLPPLSTFRLDDEQSFIR